MKDILELGTYSFHNADIRRDPTSILLCRLRGAQEGSYLSEFTLDALLDLRNKLVFIFVLLFCCRLHSF